MMRIERNNNYELLGSNNYSGGMSKIDNQGKKFSHDGDVQVNSKEIAATLEISNDSRIQNNNDGIVIKKAASPNYENHQYQSKLSALGFYYGPIDGKLTSQIFVKAISNFQTVYGLSSTNGVFNDETKSKFDQVYDMYTKINTSNDLKDLSNKNNFNYDSVEKNNFAKVYTFLRIGMGLSSSQTAGVLANIHVESRMSSDNKQNTSSNKSDHDGDYTYAVKDSVGYGLLQWTYYTRKQGLLDKATEMGLNVSDISAQLAYFREEMTMPIAGDASVRNAWNKVIQKTTAEDVAEKFMLEVERPQNTDSSERKKLATEIYSLFSNY